MNHTTKNRFACSAAMLTVAAMLVVLAGCQSPQLDQQQLNDQTAQAKDRVDNVVALLRTIEGPNEAVGDALADELETLGDEVVDINGDLIEARHLMYGEHAVWAGYEDTYDATPIELSLVAKRVAAQEKLGELIATNNQASAAKRDEALKKIGQPDTIDAREQVSFCKSAVDHDLYTARDMIDNLFDKDGKGNVNLTDAEKDRLEELRAELDDLEEQATQIRADAAGHSIWDDDYRLPLIQIEGRVELIIAEIISIKHDNAERFEQTNVDAVMQKEADQLALINSLRDQLLDKFGQIDDKLADAYDLLKQEGLIEVVSDPDTDDPDIPNFPETAPGWNSTYWDFSSP